MSHKTRFPNSYDEEDKKHAIWWSDQSQLCKSAIADIQEEIAKKENVKIAGSHTATKKNGKHEVKVSFVVDGESFENRLEGNKNEVDE